MSAPHLEAPGSGGLVTVRLSCADIPEILGLLNEIWPQTYGSAGCPVFSEAYLRWLYGGPSEARNLLVGCRDGNGRLAAYRAFLYRDGMLDGAVPVYLGTHATLRQDMPRIERSTASNTIGKPLSLQDDPDSLLVAFYEAGKPLTRRRRNEALRQGHSFFEQDFLQYVVHPRRLAAAAHEFGPADLHALRPARPDDAQRFVELSNPGSKTELWWTPDAATLWHHMSAAPESIALAAEHDGKLCAGLSAYVMTTVRDGQHSRMVICERIIGDDPVAINLLMTELLRQADALDVRGVVVENAAMLDATLLAASGLIKTPRRMTVTIWSAEPLPHGTAGYAGDVK